MSDILKLLSNPNSVLTSQNELVNLINELMIQNRDLYDRLPMNVQNDLGANVYGIKLIRNYNRGDWLATAMFNKKKIVNDIGELISTVKILLDTRTAIKEQIQSVEDVKGEKERRDLEIIRAAISKPVAPGPVFEELKSSAKEYSLYRQSLIGQELKDLYNELDKALEFIFTNRYFIKGMAGVPFKSKTKEEISLLEIQEYLKYNSTNRVYNKLPSGLEMWKAIELLLQHVRTLFIFLAYTIYTSGKDEQYNEIFKVVVSNPRTPWKNFKPIHKNLKELPIFKILENLENLPLNSLDVKSSTDDIKFPPNYKGCLLVDINLIFLYIC